MLSPAQRLNPRRPRHHYTAAEREAMLIAADHICHLCKMKITPGQRWEASHVDIPHEHGGNDVAPAHKRCHDIETAKVTLPLIAKVKRQRRTHNGALETKIKLPCGRSSPLSKSLSGSVKLRVRGFERERALRGLSPFLNFGAAPIAARITEQE